MLQDYRGSVFGFRGSSREYAAEPRTSDPEPRPFVVVVGGANVDIVGMAAGPPQPHVSNPGRIRITPGGAGRNVAENLARLGVPVTLITAVDAGPFGAWLLDQTARAGVDTSHASRVEGRGNYYVAIESGGAVQVAVSEMAAAESLTPGAMDAHAGLLRSADITVVDANVPPATLRRAAELTGGRLCVLPVSVAKSRRVLDVLHRATLMVLTAAEAQALTGLPIRSRDDAADAGRTLQSQGPTSVVITMGDRGLLWVGGEVTWQPISPASIVDPTGAGDAVAALAVYSLRAGLRQDLAARLAAAAAAMTVGVEGATHPNLTIEALHRHAELAENV